MRCPKHHLTTSTGLGQYSVQNVLVNIRRSPVNYCIPFFLYLFMSAPVSGSGVGTGSSRPFDSSKDTSADPSFPVRDFLREHGAYLDWL